MRLPYPIARDGFMLIRPSVPSGREIAMSKTPRQTVGTVSNEQRSERISASSEYPARERTHASSDRVLREAEITRDAVVLRAELRGFTQIAEQHAARELTPLLYE